jgi:hypothetical protein
MPHPSSFVTRVLQLCFFLGYIMIDQLLMVLAMDIDGRVAE